MAYARLQPFGESRADYRAGVVATAVVNSNPWRASGSSPVNPESFFPPIDAPPVRTQPVAETVAVMEAHLTLWKARARQRKGG